VSLRRLRQRSHLPVSPDIARPATGIATLRAVLAGRARSRPGRTARVRGGCAAKPKQLMRESRAALPERGRWSPGRLGIATDAVAELRERAGLGGDV
jgi:hypothetical protein